MQFRRVIIVAALSGVLTGPACAARQPQEAGFFASADYGHANASGATANTWGLGLGGQIPWAQTGIHIELDGAYSSIAPETGPTIKTWNAGVDPYYGFSKGRAGLAIHYIGQQGSTDDTLYSYGAFGEWFATDRITLGIKSATISDGSAHNAFVGGRLTGYFLPDLATSATIEYQKEDRYDSETDVTAEAEYLISQSMPISAFGGYTRVVRSGLGEDASLFFIGLKIYADGRTSRTLVDRQRHGTLGWLSSFGTINF